MYEIRVKIFGHIIWTYCINIVELMSVLRVTMKYKKIINKWEWVLSYSVGHNFYVQISLLVKLFV